VASSPYTILTGSFTTPSTNYSAPTLVAGSTLAITTAPLTANLTTDASKTYGTNDPSVNATTPTFLGRVNTTVTDWNGTPTLIDDTVAGRVTLASLTRTAGETVAGGPYAISAGTAGGTAIANYTPTVNTNGHVLTITPAALAVTADDKSRLFADPNPPFTATYSGFVQGSNNVVTWNGTVTVNDSPASLGGSLAFSTPATPLSAPGTYPITPSGVTSSNYALSFVDGTLTVSIGTATPPGVAAAVEGAIASTINPPGAAPTGLTAPGTADSVVIMMAAAGGSTTIQQISPAISIFNCGIRSPLAGCDPL
jgi:hypothetical protein